MVLNGNTMIPLHDLTDNGWIVWHKYILKMFAFKSVHPIRYKIGKLLGKYF